MTDTYSLRLGYDVNQRLDDSDETDSDAARLTDRDVTRLADRDVARLTDRDVPGECSCRKGEG